MLTLGVLLIIGAILAPLALVERPPRTDQHDCYQVRTIDGVTYAVQLRPGRHRPAPVPAPARALRGRHYARRMVAA